MFDSGWPVVRSRTQLVIKYLAEFWRGVRPTRTRSLRKENVVGAQWNMCEVDEATLTAGLQPVFMLAVLSRMSHTTVDWASGYIL